MSSRELRRAKVIERVKGRTLRLVDAAKMLEVRYRQTKRRGEVLDQVDHDKLMGQVAKRVEGKRLLELMGAFLNAGVM